MVSAMSIILPTTIAFWDNETTTSNGSFDRTAWTLKNLGYQTNPHAVTYTVLYTVLFFLGLFGNLTTIVVVWLAKSKRGWSGIDAYLINLAFSDILLSTTGVPLEIYGYWQQYPWIFGRVVCSISAFLPETCLYSSILTIVVFTYERYRAVTDPIATFRSFSVRRIAKVILAVWLLAMINAAPFAYFKTVNHLYDQNGLIMEETAWCEIPFTINAQLRPLFIYSAICFYILPMFLLAVLYVRIGLFLHRNSSTEKCDLASKCDIPLSRKATLRVTASRHESTDAAENRKRTVKVLLAIVVNFFVCYGFFHVQRLIFVFVDDWYSNREVLDWNTILFPISGFLYHVNPVLDMIFYSCMSRRFQSFYRRLLCCRCRDFSRRYTGDQAYMIGISRASNSLTKQMSLTTTSFKRESVLYNKMPTSETAGPAGPLPQWTVTG
ncbi:neuropeptides capa receptor-like [Paramacrobiotus metropolitanus]|uniref:neuropeptides capa receptor-like n=1 Tax=Paramacrobiotus metropolitanus TaxID=2943436 RepID=UPI0024464A1A|nr:neuropeptides capa receptor-like [Paramacrobiotus metropolitanus]